jgi:hypothetical protein
MAQGDAPRVQPVRKLGNACCRLGKGRGAGELRADMAADADELDARERARVPIEPFGLAVGDAELVLAQPR